MPVIRWSTTLMPNNRRRRYFLLWAIPTALADTHHIEDRDLLFVNIRFGDRVETKLIKVTGGRELPVGQDLANVLKKYADSVKYTKLIDFEASISDEKAEEGIDLEYEEAPELTDAQANLPVKNKSLPETIRQALIEARIGQGAFRVRVLFNWLERCAVTGVAIGELLRASHIKPWKYSDNRERLDMHNGLPLIGTLDIAFDERLISFADDGTMLFSDRLGENPWLILGIKQGAKLSRQPSTEQRRYLAYHRVAANL